MYLQEGRLVFLAYWWMKVGNGKSFVLPKHSSSTHLKSNKAPEKLPSQKENSLPTIHFQGLCQTSGVYALFTY